MATLSFEIDIKIIKIKSHDLGFSIHPYVVEPPILIRMFNNETVWKI